MVCFDGFQIFVAESDTGARIKARVKGVLRATHHADSSVVDTIITRTEDLQLVHAFEVPAECTQGAFDLKGKLTLGSLDCATNLQVSLCAVCKLGPSSNVVFVGHIAQRTTRVYAEVSTDSGHSQRPLREKSLLIPHHPLDGAGEHHTHIHYVRHQAAQHT